MSKATSSCKCKKTYAPKWLYKLSHAKKSFENVKDEDLAEGLVHLTAGLIAMKRKRKRAIRRRYVNGKQTLPWPWSQLHPAVRRGLE